MQYYPPMPNVHDVNRKSILIHLALPVQMVMMMILLLIVKYSNSIIMVIILGMMVVRNSKGERVVVIVIWEWAIKQNKRVSIQEMPRVIHSGQPSTSSQQPHGRWWWWWWWWTNSSTNSTTPNSSVNNNFVNSNNKLPTKINFNNKSNINKRQLINYKTIQSSLTNYGLNYSQTNFYPYLNSNSNNNGNSNGLPTQVEKEKSVNKVYPMLHKLAVNSTQSYNEGGGRTVNQEEGKVKKDGIDEMSPLYTLFDKHIGALPNANTNSTNGGGPCDKLLSSLSNVTQSVSNQLSSNEGSSSNNKKKTKDQQGRKQKI